MIIDAKDYIKHYGTPRESGRYPWGSGENPYQNNRSFLGMVDDLRKQGMTEAEIAKSMDMNTSQLRAKKSIAKNENRQADIATAQQLKEKGWSNVAIGERMGIPESTVRSYLKPGAKRKADVLQTTSNMLKDSVDKDGLIDVGAEVERHIGVSKDRLKTAVAMLEEEGYKIHYVPVEQLGTGHRTSIKVLAPPGMTYSEVYKNRDSIKLPMNVSEDNGESFYKIKPPKSIDSKRVAINYYEDGGKKADGVIYVRPGVEDVSLGASKYAQVRIAVDDTHYLKGMAVYKDDMPPGVDLVFNTDKSRASVRNHKDAMKQLGPDPDNPFGSVISRQNGVMNVLREEGDWSTWSNKLSSQMLSKQAPKLAKQQLDLLFADKQSEFEEIKSLTNPAIKARLLESFASDADSSAVHLHAAALPRQKGHHVILPVQSMKSTEIYAPKFRNGERVVLIRHPHAGTFEIPELIVNNKQPEARNLLGPQPPDAVAINSKVAERLSGADFDGDDVIVISNEQNRVKTSPALEGLKNFDPKTAYPPYEGMKPMTPTAKQHQMGEVSNLITDMTIKGASQAELAKAVRHSMVVIDAEKHNLNYKLSAEKNNIAHLKEKYQSEPGKPNRRGGASTLISRAKSRKDVPARKPRPASQGGPIDPKTGKLVFVETGETYTDKQGNVKPRMETSQKAKETDDLHTLSAGTPIEEVYADHGNRLKSMANEARKELVKTPAIVRSPSAARTYADEVAALDSKLNVALKNAPKERQAQIVANAVVRQKRQATPAMEPAEVKKLKGQELERARARVGASKEKINITPTEWEAIQAGAISNKKMVDILNNTDLDHVKKLATPRTSQGLTPAREARLKAMANAGYTQAEIADALGIGTGTVSDVLA